MKTLLPLLAAVFAAAVPAPAAPLNVSPQVQQDVKQLVADLTGIAAHSGIDPADVQALADDLQLFVASAAQPSLESVRALAEDALAALADGKLTTAEEFTILGDLNAVLESAGFTSDQIRQVTLDIQAIVTASSVTQADFQLILNDLTAILADLQGTFLVSTQIITLDAPPSFAEAASARPVAAEGTGSNSATLINALRAAIGAQASVAVDTESLQTGSYNVSVTLKSTGDRSSLGALQVSGEAGKTGKGAAVFGAGGQPLPESVTVDDIASVDVSTEGDSEPVLSGSTASAKVIQSGSFELIADAAKGSVTFQVKQQPDKTKTAFLLFAKKLPANAKLMLKVNGVSVRKVKTDAKGQLLVAAGKATLPLKADGSPKTKVTPLPGSVEIGAVQSVELDTLDGQVVATGGVGAQ